MYVLVLSALCDCDTFCMNEVCACIILYHSKHDVRCILDTMCGKYLSPHLNLVPPATKSDFLDITLILLIKYLEEGIIIVGRVMGEPLPTLIISMKQRAFRKKKLDEMRQLMSTYRPPHLYET